MLTIDIKVNGTMIGFLYIHNEGAVFGDLEHVPIPCDHRYTYEYYRPTQPLIKGEVVYGRSGGGHPKGTLIILGI